VPVELTSWPEDRAERVGVNSFGIGGANAHVSQFTIAKYHDTAHVLMLYLGVNGISQSCWRDQQQSINSIR